MFKIRDIEVSSSLVLAPIAGYFDSPFRRIARRYGAGTVCTELVSSDELVKGIKKTEALLDFHEEERPLGIQLYGRSPEVMAEAALIAESFGPDFIDINMGCPAARIIRNGEGAGSALLLDPGLVERVAAGVCSAVKVPVTAKIRTGWDSRRGNLAENLKALENGGVSLITVHGRTKEQRHDGDVDWQAIGDAAGSSAVPVVGNGGVYSHGQAMELISEWGCSGIMIGQAAYGNPWIFSGESPSMEDKVKLVEEHLDLMVEHYGDWGVVMMRKHIVKYLGSRLNENPEIRKLILASENRAEVAELVRTFSDCESFTA